MLANAERVARIMKLLSHPQRLCMLRHIAEKPRNVTELVELCGVAQPQVSQFMASLREAGIIDVERDGRFMIYKISDNRVLQIMQLVAELYCHDTAFTPNHPQQGDRP